MAASLTTFLITDENVCGVEIPAAHSAAIAAYLRANKFEGPSVHQHDGSVVYLAAGLQRAHRAVDAMRRAGFAVHARGARVPLPRVLTGDLLPVVVIAAAIRAAVTTPVPTDLALGLAS